MTKIRIVLCAAFASGLAAGQTTGAGSNSAFVFNPYRQPVNQFSKRFPPDVIATTADGKLAYSSRRVCVYPSGDRKALSIKPCEKPARRLRLMPLRFIAPPGKP